MIWIKSNIYFSVIKFSFSIHNPRIVFSIRHLDESILEWIPLLKFSPAFYFSEIHILHGICIHMMMQFHLLFNNIEYSLYFLIKLINIFRWKRCTIKAFYFLPKKQLSKKQLPLHVWEQQHMIDLKITTHKYNYLVVTLWILQKKLYSVK